ncbi:DUF4350 domain-containing protein [Demequina sp. TTPB684]|uniref:DUF4350 domain-containing protein n=1 Tax=unclassified Demequina TaxID=2620311 RepID=UPI001CF32B35|nr:MULTISPECIES: DUF4350 domain-containing protein [unclassified Demequina]MCB2413590.1 DUF4350 domain-containing protein [Demequina sp. TTPB684]UPU88557.1 DUF4350 domain-containing protein [Demequina sp. TMPB413]
MTTDIEVTSDGFTRRAEGPGVRRRVAGAKWFLGIALLVMLLAVIAYAQRADNDYTPLSIKNYEPDGARALAEVAGDRGLDIRQIDELSDAHIFDPDATTLVIANGQSLQAFQARTILDYPGDVVIIGDSQALFAELGEDLWVVESTERTLEAGCSHVDARAAGTVTTSGAVIAGTTDATARYCFTASDNGGSTVVFTHGTGGGRVTLVADPAIVINDTIDNEGNAALALRLIGKHDKAVWYLGSYFDTTTLTWTSADGPQGPAHRDDIPASTDFLPPGTGNAVFALVLAMFVVALWRARRFGPLVHEPLPVVIRSSESTRGRARLYRSAGASGRAAASLRASAATRIGARIGVPRSASKAALIAATARAAGRSAAEVEAILYGPAPQSESAMMDLVEQIDTLEREVHRT